MSGFIDKNRRNYLPFDAQDFEIAIERSRPHMEAILRSFASRTDVAEARIRMLETRLALQEKEVIRLRAHDDDMQGMLNDINDKLTIVCEQIMSQEKVIIVREIPFEEAYAFAKEYIKGKDLIDPLDFADDLHISYGQAHEIMLKLEKEGLVEPDE